MITEKEKSTIIDIAKRYHAKRILLFGSSADPGQKGRDIDLAVEGLLPQDFFSFYAELLFSLSLPVDLVDLTSEGKFNRMILREGIPIYG